MKPVSLRLIAALLLLTISGLRTVSAQSDEAVATANREYRAGNFRAAAERYQAAVDAGARSAALFYNLGNASYRAGDVGRAILNYERALVLKPQHPEARANLHLAQDKARALELKTLWWDQFIARTTSNQLSIAAAVGFWLTAFFFVGWWVMARRTPLRLAAALLALLMGGVSMAALYALEAGRSGRDLAIVIRDKTEARVATADNAGSVLVLPPGSQITILSVRGDWIYAALPNDLRGWIPAGSAERVRMSGVLE